MLGLSIQKCVSASLMTELLKLADPISDLRQDLVEARLALIVQGAAALIGVGIERARLGVARGEGLVRGDLLVVRFRKAIILVLVVGLGANVGSDIVALKQLVNVSIGALPSAC